jgi:hypothetical protein
MVNINSMVFYVTACMGIDCFDPENCNEMYSETFNKQYIRL